MDLSNKTTPGATAMTPSLRIRRLCARLTQLSDVVDQAREATASPPSVEQCLSQLEANAMLLEHELTGPSRVILTSAHPDARGRVRLKFPLSAADSVP
jgi:hypothetical protein